MLCVVIVAILPRPTLALKPIESQWAFVNLTQGLAWTDDFSGITGIGFGLSTHRGGNTRVDLQFTYGYSPLTQISDLNSRIEGGVNMFTLGVDYNLTTTPDYTLVELYFLFGLAYNNMAWKYTEPVDVEDASVQRDAISGLEVYFGAGSHVFRWQGLRLTAELVPGYIVWIGGSNRGFNRESFNRFYNVKLNLGISFQIRG